MVVFYDPRDQDSGPTLFYIDGHDSFAAFLAILDTQTNTINPVDHVPWHVNYGAVINAAEKKGQCTPECALKLGKPGRNYTGHAKLGGNSQETHNTARFESWRLEQLSVFAKSQLKGMLTVDHRTGRRRARTL